MIDDFVCRHFGPGDPSLQLTVTCMKRELLLLAHEQLLLADIFRSELEEVTKGSGRQLQWPNDRLNIC